MTDVVLNDQNLIREMIYDHSINSYNSRYRIASYYNKQHETNHTMTTATAHTRTQTIVTTIINFNKIILTIAIM